MNVRIAIMVLISILIKLSISAGQPDQLPHILRELETGRNRKIHNAQTKALEILLSNPNCP